MVEVDDMNMDKERPRKRAKWIDQRKYTESTNAMGGYQLPVQRKSTQTDYEPDGMRTD